MTNVIRLPKPNPPLSIESIIMKWVDEAIEGEIGAKQFGGISGTSTTDVFVEVIHL